MANQPRVVIFTTSTCSWCNTAKKYLKQNKIVFKEINISKDPQGARDIVQRTGQQAVPVILVNNRPVIGFNKTELNKLLNIKGG